MKIKSTTPFLFGYRATIRRPPRVEMTAIVRGTFTIVPGGVVTVPEGIPLLVQGAMTGEIGHVDDDARMGECLYPNDFANDKHHAEVMLRGTCHVPRGEPIPECPVRFAVGEWSKILRVIGPRVWTEGGLGSAFSAPLPFTKMPLGYDHAFGGPGYAPNPVGKGVGTSELPNVEHAGDIVRSRSDRPAPAGFGPISAAWPQRAGKLGRAYGKGHRQHAPAFAEDFDWSFFQAAPADQQLSGFLRGDEELTFQNLHPTIQVLTTRLPGLRIRVFIKDAEGAVREAPMRLDTLFADLDRGTVTLTWRGLVPVKEADLADVETVLLASERLDDDPLPEDHYRGEIDKLEADPLRVREVMPEGLRDVAEQAVYHRRLFAPGSTAIEAGDDPLAQALREKIGHLPPAAQQQIWAGIARIMAAPMPPGVDLRRELEKAVAEMPPPPATSAVPPPGVFPIHDARIGRSVAKVRALVDEAKASAAKKGVTLAGVEKYEQVLADLRALDLPGDEARATSEASAVEPGPGRDLSHRDFSGWDLRGRDLRGAKLDGAILARADLRGAQLEGASLRAAVLVDAALEGADLSRTDLYRANLQGARAAGATLRGAKLHQTVLDRVDLTGATLVEVEAEMTIVAEADLSRVDAQRARFEKSLFREVTLTQADFSGASAVRCSFLRCRATGARFEGATLTKTSFTESNLQGARFVRARGERASFLRATLDDADLSHAVLVRAVLREATATRARGQGVNLREAHLYRARLDRVDLGGANLAGAILTRATLHQVIFAEANLYAADFTQAAGTGCDFTGANLTRCSLEGL
ncbi:Pentapeptide repeat family protein [Minicystis rosea]|nr:Pentapeptide repeat family protein [Minicystis rosea]